MIRIGQMLASLAASVLMAPCWATAGPPVEGVQGAVFAVVDGVAISVEEFEGALSAAITQKFYHRRPPEDQMAALRNDVADGMVNKVLLLKEAQRRGIRPDEEKLAAERAAYEKRYSNRPQWQESRAQLLPALTRALQEKSLVAQLEAAVRAVAPTTEAALRAYYEAHLESFTEPERLRLSMILLKVDPSAPPSAWAQARARAQDLVEQLSRGADFAELARLHSDDSSARDGGDMGYWHRGRLPQDLESEVDKMAVGAIPPPFRLLEGMAVLRLAERKPAQLRKFAEVRGNVAELWAREQGDSQWRDLLARLRADASITLGSEVRFDTVTAAGGQSPR